MPRDKRLYMTFPIDMHRHPKLRRLAPDVKWTFFEMNGEARIEKNDGVFTTEDAEFNWPVEHLEALCDSHPKRPLLLRTATGYVIRDYAEHQFTTADEAELSQRNRANGSKGGRPPKNRPETQSVTSRSRDKAESESESESGIDGTYVTESLSGNTPPTTETDPMSRHILTGRGIAPDRLITHIKTRTGLNVNATTALQVALNILERAGQVNTTEQQYVLGAITRSPVEVQQFIYENGLT